MTSPLDFGIRSVPPCSDCWPDGQCSMNCGPAIPPKDAPPFRITPHAKKKGKAK